MDPHRDDPAVDENIFGFSFEEGPSTSSTVDAVPVRGSEGESGPRAEFSKQGSTVSTAGYLTVLSAKESSQSKKLQSSGDDSNLGSSRTDAGLEEMEMENFQLLADPVAERRRSSINFSGYMGGKTAGNYPDYGDSYSRAADEKVAQDLAVGNYPAYSMPSDE